MQCRSMQETTAQLFAEREVMIPALVGCLLERLALDPAG